MTEQGYATLTTAQVVTLGTDILACPVSSVQDALALLVGERLEFTHQLPRAIMHVKAAVIEAQPWVENIPPMPDLRNVEDDALESLVYGWIDSISALRGEYHEVPIMSDTWVRIDPMEEFQTLLGAIKAGH